MTGLLWQIVSDTDILATLYAPHQGLQQKRERFACSSRVAKYWNSTNLLRGNAKLKQISEIFTFIAGLFAVIAVCLAMYGLRTIYDNSYSQQVVGGDAYNYIIYATRGTAFICAGIVSAVLSVTAALASLNLGYYASKAPTKHQMHPNKILPKL